MQEKELFQILLKSLDIEDVVLENFSPEQIYHQLEDSSQNILNSLIDEIDYKFQEYKEEEKKETKRRKLLNYDEEDENSESTLESGLASENYDAEVRHSNNSASEEKFDDCEEDFNCCKSDSQESKKSENSNSMEDENKMQIDDDLAKHGLSEESIIFEKEDWECDEDEFEEIVNKPASSVILELCSKNKKTNSKN